MRSSLIYILDQSCEGKINTENCDNIATLFSPPLGMRYVSSTKEISYFHCYIYIREDPSLHSLKKWVTISEFDVIHAMHWLILPPLQEDFEPLTAHSESEVNCRKVDMYTYVG